MQKTRKDRGAINDSSTALGFKRKLKDDETILAKVRKLGEDSRASPRSNLTLADLAIPNVSKEVVDLATKDVVGSIEKTFLSIAKSILAGNGFGYSVPSRASTNQVTLFFHVMPWNACHYFNEWPGGGVHCRQDANEKSPLGALQGSWKERLKLISPASRIRLVAGRD